MKNLYWFLLVFSAVLYAIPFLLPDILWCLIFLFPVPLLYLTRTENLSCLHGYVWGIIIFSFHLYGGTLIVSTLAGDYWIIGFIIGIGMVLYQALVPAALFWLVTRIKLFLAITSPIIRLCLWVLILAIFIFWADRYCLWIFGMDGYPFMHPLLLLAHYPSLLCLLPIVGKQVLLMLFLLVPASIVIILWYRNYLSVFLLICVLMPWIGSAIHHQNVEEQPLWYAQLASLPCMIRAHSTSGVLNILTRHMEKLIAKHPQVSIIIMPESALDIIDEEFLYKLHEKHLTVPLHLIFGACSYKNAQYYNSLYWLHYGAVQECFDKKYVLLIAERLADWMDTDWLRKIYFKDDISITSSCNERRLLEISESVAFVPYICSELFFNEYPDDCYPDAPIIAIVNDTVLIDSYIQKLLLLSAQCKAIQWQRHIVYVSYGVSVLINKQGMVKGINK